MAKRIEITTSMLCANEYPDHTHTFIMHHTYGTSEQGGSGIQVLEVVDSSDNLKELQIIGQEMYPRPTTWEPDGFRIYINLSTEEGKRLWKINEDKHEEICQKNAKDRKEHPENWSTSKFGEYTIHVKKLPWYIPFFSTQGEGDMEPILEYRLGTEIAFSNPIDPETSKDYPKIGLMMPSMCGFIDSPPMEYFITKPIDPGTPNGASQETHNS